MRKFKILFLLALFPAILFGQGRYPFHAAPTSSTVYQEEYWALFENNEDDEVGGDDWLSTDIVFVTTPTPIPEGTYAARSLDASGDFGQLPVSFSSSAPSSFTFSFFFNTSQNSTILRLFESGTAYSTGFTLRLNSTGNDLDFFTNSTELNATNFTTDAIDVWFHFAVSYDSSTGAVEMYVNGVDEGGGTGVAGITTTNPWFFMPGVAGWMDDLRVYPRVLTPAEVSTIYNNPGNPL